MEIIIVLSAIIFSVVMVFFIKLLVTAGHEGYTLYQLERSVRRSNEAVMKQYFDNNQ